MVTVVHLFQVVRHRRIDADADGAASRKARRTALPATSREKMVRISSFLQPSLLQLVQVNRPNTTLTTNKQTQKNRKFSSCARPMKRFLTANQLESALFCLKILIFSTNASSCRIGLKRLQIIHSTAYQMISSRVTCVFN